MLSAAAVLTVIGLGQVQIAAIHTQANLYADPYFDIGLAIGGIAILVVITAISANGSQSKAKGAFPNVAFTIILQQHKDGPDVIDPDKWQETFPDALMPYDMTVRGIRVTNYETNRYVNLEFNLIFNTEQEGDRGFRPIFADWAPWNIGSGTSRERMFSFEVPKYLTIKPETGRIEVADHSSGRRIRFPDTIWATPPKHMADTVIRRPLP